MKHPRLYLGIAVALIAIVAFAVWPTFVESRTDRGNAAALPSAAPITADYLTRSKTIAFWEKATSQNIRQDMLSPRQLADQYLQRYRETGDVGDVLRARAAALKSLKAQPRGNTQADVELASVDLELHQFAAALAETKFIETYDPGDPQMLVREASLDLELGEYEAAKRIIDILPQDPSGFAGISHDTLVARYDELTGHLSAALLARPSAFINAQFEAPAQSRAWFFFRAGELAFESGDNDAAIADETKALTIFPHFGDALRFRARFECALKKWQPCLDDATASANITPYPETLGYEADAQRALGQADAAKQTDDLIATVERIGNSYHISDRLLAIYYSSHRIHTADAYAIAKRELAVRHDILTQDTLAWAAAMDGRWDEARAWDAKAMRYDTEIPVMQYHAGVIAEHFGDRAAAHRYLAKALALNPQFDAVYADDARSRLSALGAT